MTPAQLEVLEKLKKKQSDNPKGKKSVKSATVTEPEMETDSVSWIAIYLKYKWPKDDHRIGKTNLIENIILVKLNSY